ncbi:Semialdehyde dehydrogenase, NAD binding domain [Fictibacillus solisalsi]|uniref:Semialdehyde dehydrogenase, NAD binding domain n=1 Tax=Fictibacillus solisalsi TaxID=459525 RepID=A0A1G9V7T9_9BACL|nr:NAD-dependent epimerase/dehydratase family protein [Fictibacillus solisalsi]SDM68278.1 Semialdehyde dehydrogenase, NAD binding domain [Fictibacillus solisalsi]
MGKTAVIAGATGLVGRELLRLLVESNTYEHIIVFTRRKTGIRIEKVTEVITDFNGLEEHTQYFKAADVFCCLGTTIKKAKTKEDFRRVDLHYPVVMSRIAADQRAHSFLVISALGADMDSRFFYSRVKGEMEGNVVKEGVPLIGIFRPSLLTGEREEFRAGERAADWIFGRFSFLFKGGLKKYRPVKASSVAAAMFEFAQKEKTGVHLISSEEMNESPNSFYK